MLLGNRRDDFFPFNRAELRTSEPEIYDLLRKIWGPAAERARPAKQRAAE